MAMRLGMLGMWHTHADGLVRQVAAHPEEFTLVGGYDPDPAVAAARAKAWGALIPDFRVFDRAEHLLRVPLDGVVVEGVVGGNLRLARMAIEAGRPVMLEKPAGTDLEEYRALLDLADRKHLRVQMIYLFRYMSAVRELVKRARAKEFGSIYEFRARLPKELSSYARFEEELKRYRGGIFFEMACHSIDLMVVLLGKPRSVTPFLGHHHPSEPGDFVDNGLAVFGYDHAWGIVEVPQLEVVPASRRVEVYGTGGAFAIPHLGSGHLANKEIQPVEFCRAGDPRWTTLELPAQTLQIMDLREFAATVEGRKAPDFSHEHDLIVQETLLRACGALPDPSGSRA